MKRTVIVAPFLLLTFAYTLFAQTPPQMPKAEEAWVRNSGRGTVESSSQSVDFGGLYFP
jgi:hypothetical protein